MTLEGRIIIDTALGQRRGTIVGVLADGRVLVSWRAGQTTAVRPVAGRYNVLLEPETETPA